MSSRQQAPTGQVHSVEIREVYERVLAGAPVHGRHLEVAGSGRAHLLETGYGPPLVLLHGTGTAAGFFAPLLEALHGVRVIAPDRPGVGLSDPVDLPRDRYRDAAVAWLDRLLDALELDTTTLAGHSGGGLRALWYALARPDRVERLVLLDPPTLPGTRCPLPMRLVATPGLGELLSRLAPPSRASVLRLAGFLGEKATIAAHPELVDLLVALGRDPASHHAATTEHRVLISPLAMVSPSGFRHRARLGPGELGRLAVPTLLIWGEHDPLGGAAVARTIAGLIPQARLELLPTGHVPWLGQPGTTATAITEFMATAEG